MPTWEWHTELHRNAIIHEARCAGIAIHFPGERIHSLLFELSKSLCHIRISPLWKLGLARKINGLHSFLALLLPLFLLRLIRFFLWNRLLSFLQQRIIELTGLLQSRGNGRSWLFGLFGFRLRQIGVGLRGRERNLRRLPLLILQVLQARQRHHFFRGPDERHAAAVLVWLFAALQTNFINGATAIFNAQVFNLCDTLI